MVKLALCLLLVMPFAPHGAVTRTTFDDEFNTLDSRWVTT